MVRLQGEIDLSVVCGTSDRLKRAVRGSPPPDLVVLDLSDVTFLSVAAVRTVAQFADACADRGVCTRLVCDPDGIVRRVATLAGLGARVRMFDALADAL